MEGLLNIQEFDEEDMHFISIKQAGGSVKEKVELGKCYQYLIEAEEGWEINAISFNGVDVTSQLDQGIYTTPIITGNSELSVVFHLLSDDIKSISNSTNVKVNVSGNTVSVSGAKDSDAINVFNTNGMLVKAVRGNGNITLDESGLYIIKIGDETFKVKI